jgi:hypothetical protein
MTYPTKTALAKASARKTMSSFRVGVLKEFTILTYTPLLLRKSAINNERKATYTYSSGIPNGIPKKLRDSTRVIINPNDLAAASAIPNDSGLAKGIELSFRKNSYSSTLYKKVRATTETVPATPAKTGSMMVSILPSFQEKLTAAEDWIPIFLNYVK